jgi:hypothetical protein
VQTRVKRLTMHRNNQDTETSKITQQNWMIQLPQSPEPDTRYYLHLVFMGYSFYLLHCLLKMKIILEKRGVA